MKKFFMWSSVVVFVLASCKPAVNQNTIDQTAIEAMAYFYPALLYQFTKEAITNVDTLQGNRAPVNMMSHKSSFPAPDDKTVVRLNFDTLYSQVFFDLSKEPMIFSYPTIDDRYFVFPFLDAWSNIFYSINSVYNGNQGQTIAFVAPDWQGTLPEGVKKIIAPTNQIWFFGRIFSDSKDVGKVNAIQKQMQVYPLSYYGKAEQYVAPGSKMAADVSLPPIERLQQLSAKDYYTLAVQLVKQYKTLPADTPFLKKIKDHLGIDLAQEFNFDRLPANVQQALVQSLPKGTQALQDYFDNGTLATHKNGWIQQLSPLVGNYGTNYTFRAMLCWLGYGANPNKIAIYGAVFVDNNNAPLEGTNRYVIHFDKDQIPQTNGAFWSITLYDDKSFHVPNPLNRFNLNSSSPLVYNADGSLDLYFQYDAPSMDKQANWIPAPKGLFNLTLRIYNPTDTYLSGNWETPAVTKVE
jgi:hypothetical protein